MEAKASQVMAITGTKGVARNFMFDEFPKLGGKFASIDPVETARFNNATQEWVRKQTQRLAEILPENKAP